jgi:hypothetical protein
LMLLVDKTTVGQLLGAFHLSSGLVSTTKRRLDHPAVVLGLRFFRWVERRSLCEFWKQVRRLALSGVVVVTMHPMAGNGKT